MGFLNCNNIANIIKTLKSKYRDKPHTKTRMIFLGAYLYEFDNRSIYSIITGG